ncbi:ABC transporter substrate-binding protein [Breznakiella homolactica]|uniref:ABC transporter substrate-binding protein n=1 Tax=Breznakiella homolactica TaxID=2798577 RepID=A0A7T7XKA3_9SPIR|nr:ABC transporter substrate-binding protein [Breznakiella homolactica]QQO07762.1 ABC transporter substrate-binding protein [Breznakiella homolactica]
MVTDMRGKTVILPRDPKRIATIDDGFVEGVLTRLGEIHRVAAIGSWAMKHDYSYSFTTASGEAYSYTRGWNTMKYLHPWLDALPCISSPQGDGLNFETLAAADPDLVILRAGDCTVGSSNRETLSMVISTIESLGFPLVVLYAPSWYSRPDLSTMTEEMAVIGSIFGKEKEARELGAFLYGTVDLIRSRTADIPENQRTGLVMLGLNPSVRAQGGVGSVWGIDTPESYIMESIVNGRNLYRGNGTGKILNPEQLYALDPETIILPTWNGFHPPREILEGADFTLLAELRAIKNRRVYAMPWTPMNCSRRLEYPLDMIIIAKAAYPDRFADIKVHEFALQLYKDLYGVDDAGARGLRSAQWLDWTVDNDF